MDQQVSEARTRLLATATRLFYLEGLHSVGIDRIIERAGVAKASLYSSFGSKDELVRAYLQGRHEIRRGRLMAGLERYADPRDRLLGVFDVLAEVAAEQNFRGCAFYNASAEGSPGGPVDEVVAANRAWTRGLFTELARDAGARDLDELVRDFRERPLDAGPYTFVAADALVLKVREGGRIVNVHALLATGVNAEGYREILGLHVTTSEDGAGGWRSSGT